MCHIVGAAADSLKWYVALDTKKGAQSGFTSFKAGKEALTATYHDQV